MARIEIKKLDVVVYAKVMAAIMAVFGLVYGVLIAALGAMIAGLMPGGGATAAGFGLLSIVLFPIMCAIMGFIIGAVGAFIYNLVARKVGGIVFES